MADLSSCYFCGAAMDVSLREHHVVPAAFSPSTAQQTTVVLCGTCERKLERVLGPVVDAATASARAAADASAGRPVDDATTPDAGATDDDATAAVPSSILSDVADDATDDDATDDDATDAVETAAAGDADARSTGGDDGTPFEVDDTASVFDDGADETASDGVFADDRDATTIPDAEADKDGTDGIAFGEQTDDRASNTPQNAGGGNADTTDADGADDSTPTSERSATPAGDSTTTDATDDGTDATDDGTDAPDVDPRTYNKVVRLLKNRDLPVARAEIESIAGSAYDIPDHECEAIVDAAIQRGLVAEDGSDLTYPDGV